MIRLDLETQVVETLCIAANAIEVIKCIAQLYAVLCRRGRWQPRSLHPPEESDQAVVFLQESWLRRLCH